MPAVVPTCGKRSLTVSGVIFQFYPSEVSNTVQALNEEVTVTMVIDFGDVQLPFFKAYGVLSLGFIVFNWLIHSCIFYFSCE